MSANCRRISKLFCDPFKLVGEFQFLKTVTVSSNILNCVRRNMSPQKAWKCWCVKITLSKSSVNRIAIKLDLIIPSVVWLILISAMSAFHCLGFL
jgi:hypothetical protein